MRIGTSLAEPAGPDALSALADQIRAAAADGFASAWMSNIFGLEALTALAVAGLAGAWHRARYSSRADLSPPPGRPGATSAND